MLGTERPAAQACRGNKGGVLEHHKGEGHGMLFALVQFQVSQLAYCFLMSESVLKGWYEDLQLLTCLLL